MGMGGVGAPMGGGVAPPDMQGMTRLAAGESGSAEHLRLLVVLPSTWGVQVGFLSGLMVLPMLLFPALLVTLGGIIVVVVGEGLLGLFGLNESVWEFLSASLGSIWGFTTPFLRPVFWTAVFCGVVGAGMSYVRREAFRLRGERTGRSRFWARCNRFALPAYLTSALLITYWGWGIGGLNPFQLVLLGLMTGWIPALIFTGCWLTTQDFILGVLLHRAEQDVRDAMLAYQVRAALDSQRIDRSVYAKVEEGKVHLYGSVASRDERRDAERAARDLKGTDGLVSHLTIHR